MRAAWCAEYGAPVELREVDPPALGDGQVRVALHAAAVNFPDVLMTRGEYQIKVPPPFVPGSEFAGVVTELSPRLLTQFGPTGDGFTSKVAVGDRVFGSTLVGAFAGEVVVDVSALTPVPDDVDFAAAAAFGVAHRTAWHSLRSVAALQAGERVIVLGAGGGVGLAAVQLAAHLGADVVAVASSADKLAVAQAMGATALVNHRDADLRAALKELGGADVVIDPVGGDLAEPALRALRYGGRFVTVGYASGMIPKIPLNLVLLKGIDVRGFEFLSFITNRPDDAARNEAELLDLLATGVAFPHIGARFPLDDVGAALAHVADGKAIGKVILDIA
ncbi:MAG: NADPH:quinone oxidoreductase family protein [Acidimicrobiales bacterium]|nr:NADPH:quinone oxidoreductase family protein [Acidimicrobiales bacterium]